MNDNFRKCDRKWSWNILMYYSGIPDYNYENRNPGFLAFRLRFELGIPQLKRRNANILS
jgi:hypothetical protein